MTLDSLERLIGRLASKKVNFAGHEPNREKLHASRTYSLLSTRRQRGRRRSTAGAIGKRKHRAGEVALVQVHRDPKEGKMIRLLRSVIALLIVYAWQVAAPVQAQCLKDIRPI